MQWKKILHSSVARQCVCYFTSLPTNSADEKLANQNGHVLIEANPSEESTCAPLIMSDRLTVLRRTDTGRNSFVITNDRFFDTLFTLERAASQVG
jgi:hypothetical protein